MQLVPSKCHQVVDRGRPLARAARSRAEPWSRLIIKAVCVLVAFWRRWDQGRHSCRRRCLLCARQDGVVVSRPRGPMCWLSRSCSEDHRFLASKSVSTFFSSVSIEAMIHRRPRCPLGPMEQMPYKAGWSMTSKAGQLGSDSRTSGQLLRPQRGRRQGQATRGY